MSSNRRCDECGCDLYKAEAFDRQVRQAQSARDQVLRQAAEHAREIAERDLCILDLVEAGKGAQAKLVRQARAIRRLEEKLRARGGRPYAE